MMNPSVQTWGEFLQRLVRRIELWRGPREIIRTFAYRSRGLRIGRGTRLPRVIIPWPHQVSLGARCEIEEGVYFKYASYWQPGPSIRIGDRVFLGRNVEFNIQGSIEIGDDCLIASGCLFVDHDHGREKDTPMNSQPSVIKPIRLERNVWIGAYSVILKGVEIGEGAVVAAGSVVNKSIPKKEVWAGVPAKRIGSNE